jgi:type IV secretion system protein VirD4
MLDEFPALGRLDFFETALAFMAGYGIRAVLIAQSLNQIAKAYGENNSILDNCHVRVAFATNDERTARRISDALGTATEQRAMRNYAGHRLAPWLAHVMVSRQETSRPLLTPGEVMQLPATDELVLVSGTPPIRAKKLRYYDDRRFTERLCQAPALGESAYADCPPRGTHNWAGLVAQPTVLAAEAEQALELVGGDGSLQQQQRHPGLAEETVRPAQLETADPLGLGEDEDELAASAPLLSRMNLAPVVAADAINQGADRGSDLLPSF